MWRGGSWYQSIRKGSLLLRRNTNPVKSLRAEGTMQPLPWQQDWHLGRNDPLNWDSVGYQQRDKGRVNVFTPRLVFCGMWSVGTRQPYEGVKIIRGEVLAKEWSKLTLHELTCWRDNLNDENEDETDGSVSWLKMISTSRRWNDIDQKSGQADPSKGKCVSPSIPFTRFNYIDNTQ